MPESGILKSIPVDQIQPNPGNPRKRFDEEGLAELAASIKEHGIVEPLVVTQDDTGGYVLVCGERRWRAAQIAGAAELPCIVRDMTPAQAAEIMLIENVQRRDLDPIEEAKAFQALLGEHGYTQESLAEKIGVSQGQIANRLRLLRLPAEVQDGISRKIVPAAGAMELLRLENSPLLSAAAKAMLEKEVSVRQAADLVTSTMRNESKTLDPKEWNGPKFDTEACGRCDRSGKVPGWNGGSTTRCLDPECWGKKQKAQEDAEEKERRAALKGAGGKILSLDKLSGSDYVKCGDTHDWHGIDQSECQGCEKKKPALDWSKKVVDICTDPLCHRKKKNAATKAENAAKRSALEAEMDEIATLVERCGTTDKRMFIYLAVLVLSAVRNEYERPTANRYLKDAFGWDDELWGSSWMLRSNHLEKAIERLESLTPVQLVKGILFAWPAVALGTKDKLIRYALQMDDTREVVAAEPGDEAAEETQDPPTTQPAADSEPIASPDDEAVICRECSQEMRREGDFWVCSSEECGSTMHEEMRLHGPIDCPDCGDEMEYFVAIDEWRCPNCYSSVPGAEIRETAGDGEPGAVDPDESAEESADEEATPEAGSESPTQVFQTTRRYCQLCSTNTKQDLVEIDGVKKWRCQECDHCYSYRGPKAAAAGGEGAA